MITEPKKVNCLTKALWHWKAYGGTIIYDHNHAKIINSSRESHDWTPMIREIELTEHGFEFIVNAHNEFLTSDEVEILKDYFKLLGCLPAGDQIMATLNQA